MASGPARSRLSPAFFQATVVCERIQRTSASQSGCRTFPRYVAGASQAQQGRARRIAAERTGRMVAATTAATAADNPQ